MRKAFDIVFDDEYIIILNKIAKILVQPSPKKEKNTLTSLLEDELKQKVYPCHRLDRETTGLIVYAKTPTVQKEIMLQFKKGGVRKRYYAFIKGVLRKHKGVLKGKIIDREARKFHEKKKEALTFYRVLAESDDFSFIDLEPKTGRTNQLRIQLSNIGHPILGEDKYAFRRDFKVNFKRLALHAYLLTFRHPVSKEQVNLSIDLAEDMDLFLKRREE